MSKGTDNFKKVIKKYLEMAAANDSLIAETLKKPNKNIDDCITFILNTVKNSGKEGFADKEIFGLALHYYDEDDLKVGSKINTKVVVNHQIELSADEIAQAKKIAFDKVVAEEKDRLTKKKPVVSKSVKDAKEDLDSKDLFAGQKE